MVTWSMNADRRGGYYILTFTKDEMDKIKVCINATYNDTGLRDQFLEIIKEADERYREVVSI